MRSTSTRVATFQNTRVCHGPIRCAGRPSRLTMATSSALRLDRLEHLGRQIRPRRLEHGVAIGRKLGAHDVMQLDRSSRSGSNSRCRPGPSTRSNRPLRVQEGALAVLHRHAQHQKAGSWHVSFVGRAACRAGLGCVSRIRSRTRLPERSAGRGLSLRDSGHARASHARTRRCANGGPGIAQAVSAAAQAGLTVSGSDGVPCGRTAGPRLKRASGPLQRYSAFQAETERLERDSNPRQDD